MSNSSCLSKSCLSQLCLNWSCPSNCLTVSKSSCLSWSCLTHSMPIMSPWRLPRICRCLSAMSRRSFALVLRVIPFCQYFREIVIIYFYVYTVFYVVTTLSVHYAYAYWIHTMLLNMKVQFNGCFCMQTRISVEFLIKWCCLQGVHTWSSYTWEI